LTKKVTFNKVIFYFIFIFDIIKIGDIMKNKLLFIISIVISAIVLIHLFIIGFMCPNEIILGTFNNGKVSSIKKISLILYISLLLIFYLIAMLPTYIKEKNINFNLFMAFILLEILLNILPYFGS
jgi:hypothetical protein